MTCSRVVRVRATGVGHVTRCDAEHVRDETSGIGPGSSGRRDGVGTGRGTSHNMSPHSLLSQPADTPPADTPLTNILPTGHISPLALVLFSSWTLICSLSISVYPSTFHSCLSSIYISIPGPQFQFQLHIAVYWAPILTRYIVADTVGTPQLDLWGLPLCQVHSLLLFPCICYRTEDYRQCVTSVQLNPILECLCIWVVSRMDFKPSQSWNQSSLKWFWMWNEDSTRIEIESEDGNDSIWWRIRSGSGDQLSSKGDNKL